METTSLRQWIAPLFVLTAVLILAVQVASRLN